MQTIEYRTRDKSKWGAGPWQDEPDKKQWRDEATGLPCLIVRGHHGALCGYVGVAPGHPWHGLSYGDEPAGCDVHGGLTFASACSAGGEAEGICHKPDAGEPDHVWWFGFDCWHCSDLAPGSASSAPDDCVYRPLAYVEGQCASLATQLAAVAKSRLAA